jgi:hypothetical protein
MSLDHRFCLEKTAQATSSVTNRFILHVDRGLRCHGEARPALVWEICSASCHNAGRRRRGQNGTRPGCWPFGFGSSRLQLSNCLKPPRWRGRERNRNFDHYGFSSIGGRRQLDRNRFLPFDTVQNFLRDDWRLRFEVERRIGCQKPHKPDAQTYRYHADECGITSKRDQFIFHRRTT